MTSRAVLIAFLMSVVFANAEKIVWQESFETDGEGDRYQSSGAFRDSANDYFARVQNSDISTEGGSYAGLDGDYIWAAEDTDDDGGSGEDEQTIMFMDVNTAGQPDLVFSGLFAVGNTNGPGASAYDSADYAWVAYSTNSGATWIKALQFNMVESEDTSNEPLGVTRDFEPFVNPSNTMDSLTVHASGSGELGTIEGVMRPLSFTLPEADSIRIMVCCRFDAEGEEFAFDDFRIVSEPDGPVLSLEPAIEMAWPTIPGCFYQVQCSTNLVDGEWINIGDPRLADSPRMSILESTCDAEKRFYRVVRMR